MPDSDDDDAFANGSQAGESEDGFVAALTDAQDERAGAEDDAFGVSADEDAFAGAVDDAATASEDEDAFAETDIVDSGFAVLHDVQGRLVHFAFSQGGLPPAQFRPEARCGYPISI